MCIQSAPLGRVREGRTCARFSSSSHPLGAPIIQKGSKVRGRTTKSNLFKAGMIIFTKKLLLEFYHSSSFCGNASAKVQTSLETRPLIRGCCVCRSQHGGAGAGQGEGEDCEGTACLVCGVWAAGRAPCCRRHAVERAGFFSSNSPLWCFVSSPAVPAACWPDVPEAEVGATLLTCAPVSLGCPSSRQAPSF